MIRTGPILSELRVWAAARPFPRSLAGNLIDMADAARQPIRVLLVDDDADVRALLRAALDTDPRLLVVGEAPDGMQAVRRSRTLRPDVVVMDVNMPHLDGAGATAKILAARPDTRVIALTGQTAAEAVSKMVLAGAVGYAVKGADPQDLADVVTRAVNATHFIDAEAVPGLFESLVKLARDERRRRAQAERLAADVTRTYHETVRALASAIRYRDSGTDEHGDRVARRVGAVGELLDLAPEQLSDLEYGAMFHDIGKIAMPDSILHNRGELSDDDWRVIRQHTIVGADILRPISFLRNVGRIVRHSHEHWDGTGYPDQLNGEQIPIESRIIFACDALDAMTSHRTYQRALSREDAIARMRELAGSHFDPRVVEVLLQVVAREDERASLSSTP